MAEIETSELIGALLEPDVYPHHPQKVELAQTRMSLVFLTGQFAYKVKKPVNLGYLDYTTLGKRLYFCQQEVQLNRRLCPEVYLGVAPICRKGNSLVMEEEGDVVEYAVKMMQLPQDRMMDVLLEKNQVTGEMASQVAAKMVQFHREAETNPVISAFGSLDIIETNTEENFYQTEKYFGVAISSEEFEVIKSFTHSFIKNNEALFRHRIKEERIRDCHGDLHAANVCFLEVPLAGSDKLIIYDCIEFNDRFRYCDVASEIAFLAMDMDFHSRADLSNAFSRSYIHLSGDEDMGGVLNFYKVYRAYVRGKVECFKAEDKLIPKIDRERALQRAKVYFKLAYSYTRGSGAPMDLKHPNRPEKVSTGRKRPYLLITVGLVGTGKTALAEALARKLDMIVISSDIMRKKLAGIPLVEHHYDEFDKGLYSLESTKRTYDALLEEADSLLSQGKSVILDASFRRSAERQKAQQVAQARDAYFWIIEVTCPEDIVRQRLEKRIYQGNAPSDGRWEIYIIQKKDFAPIEILEGHILVDTSRPMDELVGEIMRRLEMENQSPTSKRGKGYV